MNDDQLGRQYAIAEARVLYRGSGRERQGRHGDTDFPPARMLEPIGHGREIAGNRRRRFTNHSLRLRLLLRGGASSSPSGLLCFRLPSFFLEYRERAVHRLPDKLRCARVELPGDRNQSGMLIAG